MFHNVSQDFQAVSWRRTRFAVVVAALPVTMACTGICALLAFLHAATTLHNLHTKNPIIYVRCHILSCAHTTHTHAHISRSGLKRSTSPTTTTTATTTTTSHRKRGWATEARCLRKWCRFARRRNALRIYNIYHLWMGWHIRQYSHHKKYHPSRAPHHPHDPTARKPHKCRININERLWRLARSAQSYVIEPMAWYGVLVGGDRFDLTQRCQQYKYNLNNLPTIHIRKVYAAHCA